MGNQSDNSIAKIDYHINARHPVSGVLFVGNYTGVGEDHTFVNQGFLDTSPIRTWFECRQLVLAPPSSTVKHISVGYNCVDFSFLNNDDGTLSDGHGYPLNTGITI